MTHGRATGVSVGRRTATDDIRSAERAKYSRTASRRVAYLVSQYPAYSHAFITNEIEALREQGWTVDTFSVKVPSFPDPPEVTPTFVLQRAPIRTLFRTAGAFAKRPSDVIRGIATVASIVRGRQDRSIAASIRQLAYLYEALVLSSELDRRGIRHLHVHFANNAADIARIATAIRVAHRSKERPSWSMTIHGPADFERGREHDLRGKAASADALFCISEFAREEMKAFTNPADADRTVICRMGVSGATLKISSDLSPSPHADVFRVLFVGRLVAKKDPRGLVAAASRLASLPEFVSKRIQLTVVGDGPEREALAAARDGLPSNLSLDIVGAASHEAVLAHYADADVFCLPSYSEGLPVVVMEALAAGLAVVATPVAAVPELVRDEVTGLLVQPGDTSSLVAALRRLAESPDLRCSLGRAGRAAVEAEFVSSKTAEVLSAAFTRFMHAAEGSGN